MLRFVVDNNIASHWDQRDDKKATRRELKRCVEDGSAAVFYPYLAFEEILVGISGSNFRRCRDALVFFESVLNPHDLLLLPADHVDEAGRVSDKSIFRKNFRSELICFLQCRSFQEFQDRFSTRQQDARRRRDSMLRSLESVMKRSRETVNSLGSSEINGQIAGRGSDLLRAVLVKDLLESDILRHHAGRIDDVVSGRHLPSLRYFADAKLEYVRRVLTQPKKAKRSENYDPLYLLYLDTCDYFITNDAAFRRLVSDSNLAELRGRAISLDEFIGVLHGEVLPERAPLRTQFESVW